MLSFLFAFVFGTDSQCRGARFGLQAELRYALLSGNLLPTDLIHVQLAMEGFVIAFLGIVL
jgi:hypothetical protein